MTGKRTLSFFAAVVVVVSLIFILACGSDGSAQKSSPEQQETSGQDVAQEKPVTTKEKVFRINAGPPFTLDPQTANDVGSAMYVNEIYSGLLSLALVPKEERERYVQERGLPMLAGEIVEKLPSLWREWAKASYFDRDDSMDVVLAPDIAKEIPDPEYNSDGTVSYTFELRGNVFFHNGKHVTAHDFKFSFERAASPNWPDKWSAVTLPTADLYLSDIVGVRDKMFKRVDEVSGVEVLSDYTLRITIDAPKPYFLWKLTYPTAFVIDKDKIIDPVTGEAQNTNWTDPPNGTGPFLAYPGDDETVLVANDNFYLGRPKIDKIIFNHEGGQNTIFAYDDGDVEITGVGVDYLPRVNKESSQYDPEFAAQYHSGPEFNIYYIGLNTAKPPFDDPLVRRAFAMAVNTEELAIVGEGLFVPAEGIVPPGVAGHRPDFKGLPFDPEDALALLKQSHYWGTKELKNIELMKGGSGPSVGPVTELVLDGWKKHLGIEIIINEPTNFGVYQNNIALGKFQVFVAGWVADYPDPEDFLDLMFYCNRIVENNQERCERDYANNRTRYHNPEFDRLMEEARVEQNHEKRMALYQQAEDIVVNDAPWIPLVHVRNSVAVKRYVQGYYPAPMVIPIFRFIDMVNVDE